MVISTMDFMRSCSGKGIEHFITSYMTESNAELDRLVKAVPPLRPKHWRQVVRATKVHMKRYAALLRAKAFQPHNFTENTRYQRGKSVLCERREKLREEERERQAGHYRKLLGLKQESDSTLLTRSLLLARSTQSTLKRFRRPFGSMDPSASQPALHQQSTLPKWSSNAANQYITNRREQMLKCLNKSRIAILKTDTQEILADFDVRRRNGKQLNRTIPCVQISPSM